MRTLLALSIVSFLALSACGGDEPPPATPPSTPPPEPPASVTASTSATPPPPAAPSWEPATFRDSIDEVFEAYFKADPVWATAVGDHSFDDAWPDITKEGETQLNSDRRVRADGLRGIGKGAPETVTGQQIIDAGTDRPALDARVLADRLDGLREYSIVVRPYEKDPSAVLMLVGSGIDRILAHPYKPLHARLDSLSTRLLKVPALLDVARARLDHPRRAGLENSALVAQGLVKLLRSDVMKPAIKDIDGDKPLADRLKKNADAAAAAIEAYEKEVAKAFPEAKADAQPIGAEAWGRIARFSEGVRETPAQVKKMGEDEIVRLQAELDKLISTAGKPGETRATFLARMQAEQPKPSEVLADYKQSAVRVEAWLKSSQFVTVPWDKAKLEVVETPPHMRGITFASMNVAGPLDTISDAKFEVNAPDATMPPARAKALLAFHALGAMDGVSAHEGLPGHYLQALDMRASPSKVRKLVWTSTSGEGWAHYVEGAILDAGFDKEHEARSRAFYLRFALQRAVRVVVDVGESDGSLTFEAAAKRLETDALLAPDAAKIEARRGMVRPVNMFSYTYGKLQIQKLRDQVKAKEGEQFSLSKFHDRFLAMGAIPVRDAGEAAFGIK